MPRGENPRSHHNKPPIAGEIKKVQLLDNQWKFVEVIGRGKYSPGLREVVRAMQITSNRNWAKAAKVLDCEATPEAIATKLVELFPEIPKGNKNQRDIVQELALGECFLQEKDGEIVRVVNLVTIAIKYKHQVLVEAYQLLHNGRRVGRGIVGVAEKAQDGETPEQAALRGIAEELEGIIPASLKRTGHVFDRNKVSKYKGIESYASRTMFEAVLKDEDVRTKYAELRDGDSTVFVWATPIRIDESGTLTFHDGRLATKDEFELSDGCIGSVFEALEPGENILLADGVFCLDDELRLGKIN